MESEPSSDQALADATETLAGAAEDQPTAFEVVTAHQNDASQLSGSTAESLKQSLIEQTGSPSVHIDSPIVPVRDQLQEVPPSADEDQNQHMLLQNVMELQASEQPMQSENDNSMDAAMGDHDVSEHSADV